MDKSLVAQHALPCPISLSILPLLYPVGPSLSNCPIVRCYGNHFMRKLAIWVKPHQPLLPGPNPPIPIMARYRIQGGGRGGWSGTQPHTRTRAANRASTTPHKKKSWTTGTRSTPSRRTQMDGEKQLSHKPPTYLGEVNRWVDNANDSRLFLCVFDLLLARMPRELSLPQPPLHPLWSPRLNLVHIWQNRWPARFYQGGLHLLSLVEFLA